MKHFRKFFNAANRVNNTEVLRNVIFSDVQRIKIRVQADSDHFEPLLN
jgi:hypothetical protein